MKTKHILFVGLFIALVFMLLPFAAFAQTRVISRTNDVRTIRAEDQLSWFAGETVEYNVYLRRGTNALAISNDAVAVWSVTDQTFTNFFLRMTGTVVSATNGHARWTLTDTQSALTAKVYNSWATILGGSGSLVADRTLAMVRVNPEWNGNYTGPVTNLYTLLDGDTLVLDAFWTRYSSNIAGIVGSDFVTTAELAAAIAGFGSTNVTAANLLANGGSGITTGTLYLGASGDAASNLAALAHVEATNAAALAAAAGSSTSFVAKAGDTMTGNLRVPELELGSSARKLSASVWGVHASTTFRAPNIYAGWSNAVGGGIIAVSTTNDGGYGAHATIIGTNRCDWYFYPTSFIGTRLFFEPVVDFDWSPWTLEITPTNMTHKGDIYATMFVGSGAGLSGLDARQLTHLGSGLAIVGDLLQVTNPAASVSLTTNFVTVIDSHVGDWMCNRSLSGPTTNNGVTDPVGDGLASIDGRVFPMARLEVQQTNTFQSRFVLSRLVDLGAIATNFARVLVRFPGASATVTNTADFFGPASNIFASVTMTTNGTYEPSAALFATNPVWYVRIPGNVPPATGTNNAWLGVPRVEVQLR